VEPIALAFLADHSADSEAVFYHSGWPSGADPFYLHASGDCDARIADYSIPRVPFLMVDGVLEPHFLYTYARILSAYEQRTAVPTSVTLDATGSYAPGSGALHLEVTAASDTPLPPGDYRIHASLTESALAYPAPNGIDVHDHTHRRFLAGPEGTSISLEGARPSATAIHDVQLDPLYVAANCRVVFFLQDAVSNEVYQAGSIDLSDLPEPTAVERSSWSSLKALY